jgi:DNA-binding transcriptional ArsR family regulator
VALRLIVWREPSGPVAGDIARQLGVPQNTLSAHLSVVAHADLVKSGRNAQSITYPRRSGALESA